MMEMVVAGGNHGNHGVDVGGKPLCWRAAVVGTPLPLMHMHINAYSCAHAYAHIHTTAGPTRKIAY